MMKNITSKIKLIVLIVVFIIFATVMYLYGYGIMGMRNQSVSDELGKRNIELEVLLREKKSFEQGKKDLAVLEKSDYPPDELFSSDTKVVKEIQLLETAAQRYNLDITIAVSGSVKEAKKVEGTTSELFAVPYTLTVTGSIESVLQFIQAAERMPFVSQAKTLNISADSKNGYKAAISSEFYIKK